MASRSGPRVAAFVVAFLVAGWLSDTLRAQGAPSPGNIAEFWEAPIDLEHRDLFNGPWGVERAPDPAAVYTFVEVKKDGINPGMTVTDAAGREWKVKQPPLTGRTAEGPIEVVLSRVLSAVGYHQPPVYFLDSFLLKRDGVTRRVPGGRFRLKVRELKDQGAWPWRENPYAGTPPHHGLLVILLMFNSSDLKDSNNTVYQVFPPVSTTVERWFVVRDLGTALGSTARLAPKRADIAEFERRGFIKRIDNGLIDFQYDGRHQDLVDHRVGVADVIWASHLLSRLTVQQWHDAFRAGGFERELRDRFINKLQQKIREGLALRTLRLTER